MQTEQQRLYKLLTNPQWTAEEEQWMEEYLNKNNHTEWHGILQSLLPQDEAAAYSVDNAISQRIRESLKDRMGKDEPRTRIPIFRRHWLHYAAVLLLIAGVAGVYLWLSRQNEHPAGKQTQIAEITPGGNKAVLTLADGSTILLDSAANGNLAQQGNVRIIKLAGGQLSYIQSQNPEGLTNDNSKDASFKPSRLAAAASYNTITTPRGGQYQVILPDGSKVWLNAASSVKFPTVFDDADRTVAITGEAYFEIASDINRPFYVNAGDVNVQVLGTEFNIMCYPDEDAIKTTLITGAVKVKKGKEQVILKPLQQASVLSGSVSFNLLVPDPEEVLAWKNGRFRFEEASIKTIMRQLARWYDVDIKYTGDLTDVELSGAISRKENISQLLKQLEITRQVRFVINKKTITVMPFSKNN